MGFESPPSSAGETSKKCERFASSAMGSLTLAEQNRSHAWHTLTPYEVASHLHVNTVSGLTQAEAEARLAEHGPNLLRKEKEEPFWEELIEEASEPMIILLFVTGIFYGIFGGLEDALVIAAVIVTLLGVEVVNEYRAGKAIASLQRLAEPVAVVCRDSGRVREVTTDHVVPGDIMIIQVGRRIPADARLIEAHGLAADESLLTGESGPVEKSSDVVLPSSTPLAERANIVFAGTTALRGRGVGLVVATGAQTELGRIGKLASEVKPPPTLLQRTMNELTRWMVLLAVGFSAVVPLLGWLLVHEPPQQMLLTGLSLAFATIPEELPIIITMVLALGDYRLSRQRVIIRRLQAVETIGAVTVIASDKTGTLTSDRMKLDRIFPDYSAKLVLEIGVLCSDAPMVKGENPTGDPLDVSLLEAAAKDGMDIASVRSASPLGFEYTFDNERRMMSTVHERTSGMWVGAKGAPEEILSRCGFELGAHHIKRELTEAGKEAIRSAQHQMAADGLRVVAFAEKMIAHGGSVSREAAEQDLVFVGLAGFVDPARPGVREAIAASRAAGVRTVMVTGDHSLTAAAVARQIELDEKGKPDVLTGPEMDVLSDEELENAVGRTSVFARMTPDNKLRLVRAFRADGEVVAVTGDGINDAPALAASDIGIAMGMRGTDVARETADIVLSDDDYGTIVKSVAEGRTLFSNLTKGIRYYLACKVALVSVTLLPVLLLVPIPFAPIQIILMELFMDLAAGAAFVAEPAEPDSMKKKPRDPQAKFLDRAMAVSIFTGAAGLFLAVAVAYIVTWNSGHDLVKAQTVAFVTWLLGHVLLALNMRSESEPLLRLRLPSNKLMIAWMLVAFAFVLALMSVPGVQVALKATSLSLSDWLILILLAIAGSFWMEARKWLFPKAIQMALDSSC